MAKNKGKVLTIKSLNFFDTRYLVEEDAGQWYWTDEMILMSKQEFDDKYVGNNKVVHCPTQAGSKEFSDIAKAFGYPHGNTVNLHSMWQHLKEKTCYMVYGGDYCNIEWYERKHYEIIKYKGEKEMTKSDLKEGMVVEYRCGSLVKLDSTDIRYKKDDLTSSVGSDCDIMKVYEPIWTREETKEMTVAEISEKLGYEVKVVK
jgi:hypothetical protein